VNTLLALLLATLALTGTGAEAALPAPPFALDVSPARIAAGEAALVRITPTGGTGAFDLYLMWALAPEAGFLTPEGVWSPRPVAFRAAVAATGAPITLRWVPSPPGEIPLALVVVPRGGDPMDRFAWEFRPVLAQLSAQAPAPPAALQWRVLAPLAIVTLLACAVVLLGGRPFLG
jgi:hypothetical protein